MNQKAKKKSFKIILKHKMEIFLFNQSIRISKINFIFKIFFMFLLIFLGWSQNQSFLFDIVRSFSAKTSLLNNMPQALKLIQNLLHLKMNQCTLFFTFLSLALLGNISFTL